MNPRLRKRICRHSIPVNNGNSREAFRPNGRTRPVALSASMLMGLLLYTGNTPADDYQIALEAFKAGHYPIAGDHWQRCAKTGTANCQFGLGVLYDGGYDRPQDSTQALHWYRRAALNGSRDAQVQLGFIYATGREGIAQAPVQAFVWFSMAANNGAKNAAVYRDKVAQRLNTRQLDEAYRQLNELGIQYHLQESQE